MSDRDDPMIEVIKGMAAAFAFIGGILLMTALAILIFKWAAS